MKKIINSKKAPGAIGPYSQATAHGGVLYVSGQLPMVTETGEMLSGSITEETNLVMQNLLAIVEEAGSSAAQILKCTILLTDMAYFAEMNAAYGAYFPAEPPARICYQVTALPKGARVEIDAIAAIPAPC